MSTERDELARVILEHDEAGTMGGFALADVLLAAGYRRPQQVTTVEELDALPYQTVIRSIDGNIWENLVGGWFETASRVPRESADLFLPATVLHIGGPE